MRRDEKTEPRHEDDGELSLFAMGTTLLRGRWRIARWTIAGLLIALAAVITQPALYRATASFAPQGADPGRAGLASLASQFGVAIPASGQSMSPEYYARLLKSRSLLRTIVSDTFVVAEQGALRLPFTQLFELTAADPVRREDDGVAVLEKLVGASVSKTTGIVELSASTRWRSVSIAVVGALVKGVNEFNQRSRQEQASSERQFVEGRLAIASTELRATEDRLEEFLQRNRQMGTSPELSLQRERLQREVTQRQQVYGTLAQSYEEMRIREVRDTPVITVIEPASAPALPEPRGRTKVAILGILLGGFVGVMLVLLSDMLARRRGAGDAEVMEFLNSVHAATQQVSRPFRRLTSRAGR